MTALPAVSMRSAIEDGGAHPLTPTLSPEAGERGDSPVAERPAYSLSPASGERAGVRGWEASGTGELKYTRSRHKSIAVVQSNYIPWKGYFDMIRGVDEFFLYDDVQYTRRDWRNRNRIKTPQGIQWLTIPVEVKGKYLQKIRETRVSDPAWARAHWQTLSCCYGKAPFFGALKERFASFFLNCTSPWLSDINRELILRVAGLLDVATPIRSTVELDLEQTDPSARLLEVCQRAGATEYVSGPAARDYLDVGLFERAGVRVRWMDYSGYPEYAQLHGPFEHAVTALDLLFMTGPSARGCLERQRHAA